MVTKKVLRLHWQNVFLQILTYLIFITGWDVMFNGPLSDAYREMNFRYSGVAQGNVSLVDISGGGRGCRNLKVFYFYTVSGKTYSSNIVKNSDSCLSTLANFRSLKPGDLVKVYYDKSNHSASILDPESASEMVPMVILLYIVFPVLWWFVGLISRPR
ncbi:DUF3592 domain-containing protein [Microbulbifer sp. HZ11]|uniref:DUF3592 domain-containing protein n=1 Tax=Microbulbifer sp. HZ11 TaxID=1453501 RepID=UPI0012DD5FCF